MKLSDYANHDALALAALVRAGHATAAELADCAARATDLLNPTLNAVREIYGDAVETPDITDTGPFTGVPFLLKDLSASQKDRICASGSLMLKGHAASADSEVVTRMRASGLNLMDTVILVQIV